MSTFEEYAKKAAEDEKLLNTQREMNERDRRVRVDEELVEIAKREFESEPIADGTLFPKSAAEWVLMSVNKTNGVREGVDKHSSTRSRQSHPSAQAKASNLTEDEELEAIVSVWLESKSKKHFMHVLQRDANSEEQDWTSKGVYMPSEKLASNLVQMNALSAMRRKKINKLSDMAEV